MKAPIPGLCFLLSNRRADLAFFAITTIGYVEASSRTCAFARHGEHEYGGGDACPQHSHSSHRACPRRRLWNGVAERTGVHSRCQRRWRRDDGSDVERRRRYDEFIWQNDPWSLYFDGDIGMVNPGGDYLVAYWMGRRHGMIEDDRPGTCQRWK